MSCSYGSFFTGVGGMDLGLDRAGWTCKYQCEIVPFRREILGRHWRVPRFGDVTKVDTAQLPEVDLIAGGFPCQDVSLAGKRAGLAGARSGLFYEFMRVIDAKKPTWVLIENVPGLLSSHRGRDFGVVLSALDERGYGVAWRVLDSRFFGVPQRRRRVFIVGHLGAPCPLEVLSEPEGRVGNPGAGSEAGSGSARRSRRRTAGPGEVEETSRAVLSKWRSGYGGPSGDETANLVPDVTGTMSGGGKSERGWRVGADEAGAGFIVPDAPDVPEVGATLKGHNGKGGSGVGPEDTFIPLGFQNTHSGHDDLPEAGLSAPATRKSVPAVVTAAPMTAGGKGAGRRQEDDVNLVPEVVNLRGREGGAMPEVDPDGQASLRASQGGSSRSYVHALTSDGFDASEDGTGRGTPLTVVDLDDEEEVASGEAPLAFYQNSRDEVTEGEHTRALTEGGGKPGQGHAAVRQATSVRRLTPTECCRLQGFPDDWFGEPNRPPDGPRYAALGDAVTVNVAHWIGARLLVVHEILAAGGTLPGWERLMEESRRRADVLGPVLDDL